MPVCLRCAATCVPPLCTDPVVVYNGGVCPAPERAAALRD